MDAGLGGMLLAGVLGACGGANAGTGAAKTTDEVPPFTAVRAIGWFGSVAKVALLSGALSGAGLAGFRAGVHSPRVRKSPP